VSGVYCYDIIEKGERRGETEREKKQIEMRWDERKREERREKSM
tara:strand:- start:328 stop:459 length:132 start_codon:yes stop_codon:yes gene_type:complete